MKYTFHFSVSLDAKLVYSIFLLFLHSSPLLQTPSWIPLFSPCIFKMKWCSAQACLLGGSGITPHAATSDLGNGAQQIRVYSGPLISLSFPACKASSVCTKPPIPGNAFTVVLARQKRKQSKMKTFFFFFCSFAVFLIYLF